MTTGRRPSYSPPTHPLSPTVSRRHLSPMSGILSRASHGQAAALDVTLSSVSEGQGFG